MRLSRHPNQANRRGVTLRRRRGVTLVEMLVTIGLLVLVMSILVAVFTSATGALSTERAFAALDQDLRRVESQIRLDLNGATAKMTPPVDPLVDKGGYFTYGENSLSDIQGEDTDDYMAFTAEAPAARPFTGTVMVPVTGSVGQYRRRTITSTRAEVVYFLRNGNLYRRVFLIVPELNTNNNVGRVGVNAAGRMNNGGGYRLRWNGGATPGVPDPRDKAGLYDIPTSWIGLNDLSARPSAFSPASVGVMLPAADTYHPIFNSLGDLANRQNRAFNPRHVEGLDYRSFGPSPNQPDGIADDFDANGIPDYYPTIYPDAYTNTANPGGQVLIPAPNWPPGIDSRFAFPFVYTNAFSTPDTATATLGWIHTPDPSIDSTDTTLPNYPKVFNHAPIDLGDPLGTPGGFQTWWAFPTKKEQLSPQWTDPVKRLNDPLTFTSATITGPTLFHNVVAPALGDPPSVFDQTIRNLVPAIGTESYAGADRLWGTADDIAATLMPPMDDPAIRGPLGTQPFASNAGASSAFGPTALGIPNDTWQALPEEDLLLTGVRSFDIKALEVRNYIPSTTTLPAIPPRTEYVDLGWANLFDGALPEIAVPGLTGYSLDTLSTFAHEGRIPPLVNDYRWDPKILRLSSGTRRVNIGDNRPSVIRLRRVWDSWCTSYTNTPDPIDPTLKPNEFNNYTTILPSYPAPYEAPLTGIQIQVRVVDPKNERLKILTIRHDFSNNL